MADQRLIKGRVVKQRIETVGPRIFLGAFLFPWVFDLRAVQGQEWLTYIQSISLAISISAVLFAAILIKRVRKVGLISFENISISGITLFLIISLLSGLAEREDLLRLAITAVPLILSILAIYMTSLMRQAGVHINDAFKIIIAVTVASIVTRLLMVLATRGIDFSSIRYEILSGAVPLGTAYLVTRVFSGLRLKDIVFAGVHLGIILVSVTRTQLLCLLVVGTCGVVAMWKRFLVGKGLVRLALGSVAAVFVLYVAAAVLPGNPIDRWIFRSIEQREEFGIDITTVGREAQIDFQLDRLQAGTVSEALFGFGLSARTGQAAAIDEMLARILGYKAGEGYSVDGFADNTFVSLIYLGGFLGGGILLILHIAWAVFALMLSLRVVRAGQLSWLVAPLAVVAYITFDLLGALFADRGMSLFFGVSIGMMCWVAAMLPSKGSKRHFGIENKARRLEHVV